MCNLYRLSKGPAEVAKLFGAVSDPPGNSGENVYPSYPGYVIAENRVRQMTWGFPSRAMDGRTGSRDPLMGRTCYAGPIRTI